VVRFVLLALSLEHFDIRQALVKHLLLLEVKPPGRLGVVLELPSVWWVLGKLWRSASPPKGKKQELSGVGKVVEKYSVWSWPCEQLKLPQRRCKNYRVGDSELRSTNHCVSLCLLSALPSSCIVLPRYIFWCVYCLVDIVYIDLWISLAAHCIYPVN
jgi:hypothetical protein